MQTLKHIKVHLHSATALLIRAFTEAQRTISISRSIRLTQMTQLTTENEKKSTARVK